MEIGGFSSQWEKREHSNFECGRVPDGLRQIRRTDSNTERISQPASVVCLTGIFGTSVVCFLLPADLVRAEVWCHLHGFLHFLSAFVVSFFFVLSV